MLIRPFLLILFTSLSSLPLIAVKTESLRQSNFGDFASGELKGLSLSSLGQMRPGPVFSLSAELDVDSILAAAEAEDGTLYLGTGALGKVFKLTTGNEPELILEPREVMTRALAIGPDGAVYAATSPGGRIYRIVEGDRPEVYFDPEEMYIWDLLFDNDGALYVATGNDARIYRLPPDFMPGDEAELWFETDRTHVNTLAFDHEGHLLAGAGPRSYLYRIAAKDQAEVLFNSGTDEISAIHAGNDGMITFSTLHSSGAPPSFAKAGPQDLPLLLEKVDAASRQNDTQGNGNSSIANANDTEIPSPTAGPSFLYRISPEGFGEPVWSPGAHNILDFKPAPEGGYYVATDDEARLYHVQTLNDWSLLGQADTGGSLSVLIMGQDDSLVALASNPAAIYRVTPASAEQVQYLSEPVDAGAVARWGRILPVSEGALSWRTRTGNSPDPDATWSEWQASDSLAVASPPGRYLQYEVDFETDALLRELRLFYAYNNTAPIINRINVLPVGIQVLNLAAPNKPPVNLAQLTGEKSLSVEPDPGPNTRTQVRFSGDAGAYSFGWNAFDPNDDQLTYSLAVASEGNGDYTVLADELEQAVYSTSMRGFADGYYRARVTASDALANPPGQGLSSSRISPLFLVDNSSPTVHLEPPSIENTVVTVGFAARDAFSIITSAEYTLDGQPARAAFPEDGFFDSREENFTLALEGLKRGSYSLLVVITDESGNKASGQLNFNVE